MKRHVIRLIRRSVLAVGVSSVLAGHLAAQTFKTLHSFTAASGFNSGNNPINLDGANPQAGLFLSGNILYGTTTYGGSAGNGTVFAINSGGGGFINLYTFSAAGGTPPFWLNSDGANPYASLILAANTLYGTAAYGGTFGGGTVFSLQSDGTGFKTLYSFTGANDGAQPYGSLVLSNNTLYGANTGNAVFDVKTDGTGFAILYGLVTAYNPRTGLVLSGNTLYGTTYNGGSGRTDYGTVFALNVDGTAFRLAHSFTGGKGGAYPRGGLVLFGSTLYGTTYGGGGSDSGTVFKVNTDGTGFTVLHSFSALNNTPNGTTNADGANPVAGLALSGNTLYGAASGGGSSGEGTIFAVDTNGTSFAILHSFTTRGLAPYTNSDGGYPAGGLIASGNTLYGTTYYGGSGGNGTIFSISLGTSAVPQLSISLVGETVVLTWPTNATGFTLQATTNLASPIWTSNLPAPVVINGQNTVTNPVSGAQRFYRL